MPDSPSTALELPATTAIANRPARLPALDATRLLAAAGIIWIHTVESDALAHSTELGRFAVPFFTIASIWLIGQSLRRRPAQSWTRYAVSRTRLLYVTFLLWNFIYAVARFSKHRLLHAGMPLQINASGVLLGVSEQLWFLPALLLASIGSFPVIRAVIGSGNATKSVQTASPIRWVIAGLALLLAGVAAALPPPPGVTDLGWNNALQAGYFMLPSVFVGIAAACAIARALPAVPAIVLGLPMLVAGLASVMETGRTPAAETIAGLGAFLLAASTIDATPVRWLAIGGQYAMGIYLAHVLFVEAIQAFAHHGGIGPSAGLDVFVAAAALALSLALSRLLRNTPLVPR